MTLRTRFVFACALLTAPQAHAQEVARRWITLSNVPNTQGLGRINANGYAVDITHTRPLGADVRASTQLVTALPTGQLPPAYPSQDPYGFVAWLNGVRAQNGRGAVGCDANLCNWAAVNNGQQQARGMGHHVMGPARRQNAGMGAASAVWQMWMQSPAHQAALLDTTITQIGIAANGAYWTYNAY